MVHGFLSGRSIRSGSVQFSSVVQLSLTLCNPLELQHVRPPCLSPTPRLYSCPLSQWCHPTISSSLVPFSCLQSLPASGFFQWVSSLHQVAKPLGDSASASVLPMHIQDWFPLGWTGLIFLQSKGLSRVFSNTTVQSSNSALSFLYSPTLTSIHDYWKKYSFD